MGDRLNSHYAGMTRITVRAGTDGGKISNVLSPNGNWKWQKY